MNKPVTTDTPALFVVVDGQLLVKVTDGHNTILAPVGAYSIETLFHRHILPALREKGTTRAKPPTRSAEDFPSDAS